ncbi:SIR2 family protein [Pectobacterium brasiliense]|uniref:SIR2 family protein n=1 Tax=Pectobacterium brasiliense TaxID=180957 RepID=UPI0019696AD4|nr:SIR2 family protein [Pectobacterium brasiliense]MBN3055170.1 SIR2 family protein [Pectobacterium brasiliense]
MNKLNGLSFPEKELNEILESSENNKLVFFIGSGFSKFSETELKKTPDWDELIDELKEDLNISNERDPLKIAQLYFLKFGHHSYVNKIRASIIDLEPSDFHKNLFDLNPHYIITTNWDDLIEKTAQKMGLAYDLISSDVDLAQSQLDKKIIKMHGDFRQHNFVFKEDDYLKYSHNFPLIENYIKGIFSTSTIIFMGYSYSDYNLKQIVSWITNISKATPKKYLLQKKSDDAQAHYLRNHGISLLTPLEQALSYNDLYVGFFQDLRKIKKPDEFIVNWVVNLRNNLGEEEGKKVALKKIINHFNGKIKNLFQYNTLLPEQVHKIFTNSTIEYGKDIELKIHARDSDADYNKNVTTLENIYFKDILNKDDENKKIITSLMNKAFISKVTVEGITCSVKERELDGNNFLLDKIKFHYSRDSVVILFVNNDFRKILEIFLDKVQYYLSEGNYVMATICMANYDIVYSFVKRYAYNKSHPLYKSSKKITEDFLPYDYKNKISDFPKFMQQELQYLTQIIEGNEIYKAYYHFSIESQKNQRLANTRKSGGIASSIDEYKIRRKIYPYIYFIIGNDIIIDVFIETKQFFESTILGSLEHYLIEDKFHVNAMDLFILIKYCDKRKFEEITNRLILDKKILNICELKVNEIAFIRRYLLDSIRNICKLFYFKENESINLNYAYNWLVNALHISGFVKWSPKQFGELIDCILPILKFRTQNVDAYESIKSLLDYNWYLYENSHPKVLSIIDIFLKKIVSGEFNGYDQFILKSNVLVNIYAISSKHEFFYDNIELLIEALNKIKNMSIEWKVFLTNDLLLNIKYIGGDKVSSAIDEFVLSDIFNIPIKEPDDYISKLILISHGYPIPDGFVDNLEVFINENIPNGLSDINLIKAGIEWKLPDLLKFLINEKGHSQFIDALNEFHSKMNEAEI